MHKITFTNWRTRLKPLHQGHHSVNDVEFKGEVRTEDTLFVVAAAIFQIYQKHLDTGHHKSWIIFVK